MSYTVTWKKQPGHQVIRDEIYLDLDEALSQSELVMTGPFPIEVTVTDEYGEVIRTVVSDGRSN